jgi:hypothetical protein
VEALDQLLSQITRQWVKAKQRASRTGRLQARDLARLQGIAKPSRQSIKDAAFAVMTEAYLKASDNNRLPANARQIMYCARPLVLELTGGRCWEDTDYFTQTLLPDYLERHPEQTAEWDVVFDARGRLMEPHTGRAAELGSLGVRSYIQGWSVGAPPSLHWTPNYRYRSSGPNHRYRYVLFVEKEGFYQLLEAAGIAAQYDLAIMSTKGMSVVAARRLVDELSGQGVTILVIRDFDKSGFSIVHTLRSDSRRYHFRNQPRVIDLGLRLADAERLGLQREAVVYHSKVDPRKNLRERGASEEECAVLVQQRVGNRWEGERVELNAMDSSQFVGWLRERLEAAGVGKVVPEPAVLAATYRQALHLAQLHQLVAEITAQAQDAEIVIPANLEQTIRLHIVEQPRLAWDDVVWALAQQAHGREPTQPQGLASADASGAENDLDWWDEEPEVDQAEPGVATGDTITVAPQQSDGEEREEEARADLMSTLTTVEERRAVRPFNLEAVRAVYAAARAGGKTPEQALVELVVEFDSLPSMLAGCLAFELEPRPLCWPEEAEVRARYAQLHKDGLSAREIVARLVVQLNADPWLIRYYLDNPI